VPDWWQAGICLSLNSVSIWTTFTCCSMAPVNVIYRDWTKVTVDFKVTCWSLNYMIRWLAVTIELLLLCGCCRTAEREVKCWEWEQFNVSACWWTCSTLQHVGSQTTHQGQTLTALWSLEFFCVSHSVDVSRLGVFDAKVLRKAKKIVDLMCMECCSWSPVGCVIASSSSSSSSLKPADDLSVTVLTADLLICQCGVAVSLSQLDLVGMNHSSASIIEVYLAVMFWQQLYIIEVTLLCADVFTERSLHGVCYSSWRDWEKAVFMSCRGRYVLLHCDKTGI